MITVRHENVFSKVTVIYLTTNICPFWFSYKLSIASHLVYSKNKQCSDFHLMLRCSCVGASSRSGKVKWNLSLRTNRHSNSTTEREIYERLMLRTCRFRRVSVLCLNFITEEEYKIVNISRNCNNIAQIRNLRT